MLHEFSHFLFPAGSRGGRRIVLHGVVGIPKVRDVWRECENRASSIMRAALLANYQIFVMILPLQAPELAVVMMHHGVELDFAGASRMF